MSESRLRRVLCSERGQDSERTSGSRLVWESSESQRGAAEAAIIIIIRTSLHRKRNTIFSECTQ